MLTPIQKEMDEIECPLCGSKVMQEEFRVSEANLCFLSEHLADDTLDESLTILRLIIEKVPGIKIDVSNNGFFKN